MGNEESDDTPTEDADDEQTESEAEKSFRERVEEIRQRREQEREEGDRPSPEEMMSGGGPSMGGGPGMGGGNPFAQMMSGMMGGGPGGPGAAGRGEERDAGNEQLVREVRQLRDEVRDATRELRRIADALED
ncbi:hypothetical protein ACNS7O_11910 [Haloferacaceae archaeon DSL9]